MSQPRRSTTRARRPWWTKLPEGELLDVRLCDLGLKVQGALAQRVERLYEELDRKGLGFRPHTWLSSEWFSPDGVPGIALPFYLAHPRLTRLEQKQMLKAEGAGVAECMRILRHEAGHCIDTAYRLHRRRGWRETFGRFTEPYPQFYRPRPRSRDHVLHLSGWYAQAHPAEDFAETFAVWLQPGSKWRQRYKGWPALHKLEYVDQLMQQIAGQPPAVRSRAQIEPLSQIRTTLRQHYRRKRMYYADEFPDFYDADLRKLFSSEKRYRHHPTAASFLRRIRPQLRQVVAEWTGTHPYTIDQLLRDMIDRSKELRLRLMRSERYTREQAMILVAVQTMNFLHSGYQRVAL
ncbi:MAG TPA: putative zinc-binding metallopeptidase [Phycisphaeraceae bacterium]